VAESTPAPVDAAPVPDATPETAPSEAPAEATPEPSPSVAADAPRPATLLIESEPTGANVTLGRRRRGRTPVTLSVPPGSTSVVVEKEGYLPWRESVRLKAGETRTLRADLAPVATPRPSVAAPTPAPKPAVREGDLVTLGPDVTPPRKISGPSPNIPDRLRRNLSGSVLVTFIVEIDGSTSGARVVEGLNAVVDKAVLDAVAKTRYEPARSHGVRVRVEQRAKFTFVSQ
jgi:TonB family protein